METMLQYYEMLESMYGTKYSDLKAEQVSTGMGVYYTKEGHFGLKQKD